MSDPDVAEQDAWHEFQCYTLAHGDPAFLHQHVLDAWVAQPGEPSRPVTSRTPR